MLTSPRSTTRPRGYWLVVVALAVALLGGMIATARPAGGAQEQTGGGSAIGGRLRVTKNVEGPGAGTFGFHVICLDGPAVALDTDFAIAAGSFTAFHRLPVGAVCTVTETNSGGATATVVRPAGGTVTIRDDDSVRVSFVNRFEEIPSTTSTEPSTTSTAPSTTSTAPSTTSSSGATTSTTTTAAAAAPTTTTTTAAVLGILESATPDVGAAAETARSSDGALPFTGLDPGAGVLLAVGTALVAVAFAVRRAMRSRARQSSI